MGWAPIRTKTWAVTYDRQSRTLTWRRPRTDNDAARQDSFYDQISFRDAADVIRFVNEQCQFLSALTPL